MASSFIRVQTTRDPRLLGAVDAGPESDRGKITLAIGPRSRLQSALPQGRGLLPPVLTTAARRSYSPREIALGRLAAYCDAGKRRASPSAMHRIAIRDASPSAMEASRKVIFLRAVRPQQSFRRKEEQVDTLMTPEFWSA